MACFEPRVRRSYIFSNLARDIFEYENVSVVAQFRIEADWERHCNGNLKAHISSPEDNYLSAEKIVEKICNVFPDTRKIFAICDEPALLVPKEEIRQDVWSKHGVKLLFKSDFLNHFDINQLKPMHLSLIDFEIAVSAKTFVGLSRSTFSNMVSLQNYACKKKVVENHYIYNAVGESILKRTDNGCFSNPNRAAEISSAS